MSNSINTFIVAKLTDYAFGYVESWMKENGLDEEESLNQIIESVRREAEERLQ